MTQIDFPDDTHNYFVWDADSKRVAADDSSGHTEFLYRDPDPLSLIMEKDEAGSTLATYTLGNGLEAMRRDEADSFYHFDWLGSTFALTHADEEVTDTWRYDAWGEVLARTGATVNPHTYVGRLRYYWRPDPVMCLLGVRVYDQRVGRFGSRDPVKDGVNCYAYVAGSPGVLVDPEGRQLPICPHCGLSQPRQVPLGWTNITAPNWPPCDPCMPGVLDQIREDVLYAADVLLHLGASSPPLPGGGVIRAATDCRGGPPGTAYISWVGAQGLPACIQQCQWEHECVHAQQCTKWGQWRYERMFKDRFRSECAPYLAQLSCLMSALTTAILRKSACCKEAAAVLDAVQTPALQAMARVMRMQDLCKAPTDPPNIGHW